MPLTIEPSHRRRATPRAGTVLGMAAAAALMLSACTRTGGLAAGLARINPMTMDMSEMRAAVRFPQTLRVRSAEMTVTATLDGEKTPQVRRFPLTQTANPADRAAVAQEAKAGFNLTVYRLDASQAADLAAWRQRLTTGHHGTLTLALNADGCRLSGQPTDPVPMTIYIAASPADGFHALTDEADITKLAAGKGAPAALPPCAAG